MYAMMGLTLVPLGGCLAGYIAYANSPPGLANPYLRQFMRAVGTFTKMIAALGHVLGMGELLDIITKLDNYFYSFLMDRHTGLEVRKAEFDGVPVVIYKPVSVTGTLPAVVYIHGGGFVLESPVYVDPVTSALARDTPAVVVSVDYRLAPKYPYPAGLDDVCTVTKYLMKHAEQFGLDPRRIAISGDSAGGNLAAAAALRFRDRKEAVRPKLQVLIQPVLQAFNFKLQSYQRNHKITISSEDAALCLVLYSGMDSFRSGLEMPTEAKLIANNKHTSPKMRNAYQNIFDQSLLPKDMRLGCTTEEAAESEDSALVGKYAPFILNPYMSPLLADNLNNLPSTFIMTSEYDALRDEGIFYAKHLEKAGVPVTWYHSPDTFHGSFIFIGPRLRCDTAVRDVKAIIDFLRKNL